jgi:hypothetical protein
LFENARRCVNSTVRRERLTKLYCKLWLAFLLSAAVVEHSEVCELAETLVAEIVGVPVQEHCDRGITKMLL